MQTFLMSQDENDAEEQGGKLINFNTLMAVLFHYLHVYPSKLTTCIYSILIFL